MFGPTICKAAAAIWLQAYRWGERASKEEGDDQERPSMLLLVEI